jgi:hypothetical protein
MSMTRRSWLHTGIVTALAAAGCGAEREGSAPVGDATAAVTVEPGPGAASTIQSLLDAGTPIVLTAGMYEMDAPLIVPSGARLVGAGSAVTSLVPSWSPDVSRADDRTNSLIVVRGSVDASPCTTLGASAPRDSLSITLTDATGIAPMPAWVQISGCNDGRDDEYQMSDGENVILTELVQGASLAGNDVQLGARTLQHHANGLDVSNAVPVADVVLSGFDLASDGGSIAVGVELTTAVDVTLTDVSGAGFSRALVDLGPGCQQVNVKSLTSRGEVNSMLLVESSCVLAFDVLRSAADGLRCHANGIPRALVDLRRRCSNVSVSDAQLCHGCVGIRTRGGKYLSFDNVAISDFDVTEVLARDNIPGAVMGVGVDGGANELPNAEFAMSVDFRGVTLDGCRHPDFRQAGWYLHDSMEVTLAACSIDNKSAGPNQGGLVLTGLLISDSYGTSDQMTLDGVDWPLRTRGSISAMLFGTLLIDGEAGTGSDGVGALFLGHSGVGPTFGELRLSNVYEVFATDANFNAHPDWSLTITRYQSDAFAVQNLKLALVNSGEANFAAGEIAEYDPASPAGEPHLRTPTGPTRAAAVVCTGEPSSSGIGFVMAAPLPTSVASVLCSVDAVAIGDLLVASATYPRRAEVNNSPDDPFTVIGKAVVAKDAGAESLVAIVSA